MHPNDTSEQPPAPVDWVLLARFVAGEASADDAAAIAWWLAQDSTHDAQLAELRRIWAYASVLPSEARLETLWRNLQRQMHETPTAQERPVLQLLQPRRSPMRRWLVGGMAAAGLVAAIGIALRSSRTTPTSASRSSAEQVYSTARGQRRVVNLADGSRVQLGVDSRIRVHFRADGRREVALDGEAVFNVVHDARRPFLVYARNAVTEDLGTTFDVRAYPSDSAVRVVVVSGQVALRPARFGGDGDGSGRRLNAHEAGELNAVGSVRTHHDINPDRYLAWTRGHLVFDQVSVADIALWLDRWYDVDVVITDPAVGRRLLTFDLVAPSLEEALDAVTVPLGVRYTRAGHRVTLYR